MPSMLVAGRLQLPSFAELSRDSDDDGLTRFSEPRDDFSPMYWR